MQACPCQIGGHITAAFITISSLKLSPGGCPLFTNALCIPGVGETLSLDHFSDRDETRLSSRSRLRHLQSLSLGLESRNCSLLGLSLSLEVETSLMCNPKCTFFVSKAH